MGSKSGSTAGVERAVLQAARNANEGSDRRTRAPTRGAKETVEAYPCFDLSARELVVLSLVAQGLADKEIGRVLGLSTYTINKYIGSILTKMAVTSRTAAAVLAVRAGLLDVDVPAITNIRLPGARTASSE